MAGNSQPYYFLVVFWGAVHRRHFVDLALSSLLSANNIPALDNPGGRNRFLIATTRDDWRALEGEPIFRRLKDHIAPELVEIPVPAPGASPMLTMSGGHKPLTDRAFAAGAYGIHLCPDVIYSDGSMAAVQARARAGRKVVLTAAVRFTLEGVMRDLADKGYLRKGEPLAITAREAVGIGLRNPHGEFLAAAWTSPFFWDFPVYTWWEVPGEDGIVQHTYSWSPILVDYGALDDHFTETFDDWTLDGDYVYRNFKHLEDDVHMVTDSDEIFLLPVTPWGEASPPRTPHWTKTWPMIRTWTRAYLLNMVHNHRVMDPLKRHIFFNAVLWHTKPLSPAWEPVKERVLMTLCKSIASPLVEEIIARKSDARYAARANGARADLKDKRLDHVVYKFFFYDLIRWSYIIYSGYIRSYIVRCIGFIRRIPQILLYYLYFEPVRILVLIFAYARITTQAQLGDEVERNRIKRRLRIIRDAVQARFGRG